MAGWENKICPFMTYFSKIYVCRYHICHSDRLKCEVFGLHKSGIRICLGCFTVMDISYPTDRTIWWDPLVLCMTKCKDDVCYFKKNFHIVTTIRRPRDGIQRSIRCRNVKSLLFLPNKLAQAVFGTYYIQSESRTGNEGWFWYCLQLSGQKPGFNL
jgi:hypothetical protein